MTKNNTTVLQVSANNYAKIFTERLGAAIAGKITKAWRYSDWRDG